MLLLRWFLLWFQDINVVCTVSDFSQKITMIYRQQRRRFKEGGQHIHGICIDGHMVFVFCFKNDEIKRTVRPEIRSWKDPDRERGTYLFSAIDPAVVNQATKGGDMKPADGKEKPVMPLPGRRWKSIFVKILCGSFQDSIHPAVKSGCEVVKEVCILQSCGNALKQIPLPFFVIAQSLKAVENR
jgi:hypothetical protein